MRLGGAERDPLFALHAFINTYCVPGRHGTFCPAVYLLHTSAQVHSPNAICFSIWLLGPTLWLWLAFPLCCPSTPRLHVPLQSPPWLSVTREEWHGLQDVVDFAGPRVGGAL
jgi:hypothetical protein